MSKFETKAAEKVVKGEFVRVNFARFEGFVRVDLVEENPGIPGSCLLNHPGGVFELPSTDQVEVLVAPSNPDADFELSLG